MKRKGVIFQTFLSTSLHNLAALLQLPSGRGRADRSRHAVHEPTRASMKLAISWYGHRGQQESTCDEKQEFME